MKKITLFLAFVIAIGTNMANIKAFAYKSDELYIINKQAEQSEDMYMDRYAVLNIYDWDGVTKLSSLAVPKGIGISEFLPSIPKPGYIHSGWTSILKTDGSKNIATPKPIRGTNKNPYDGEKYDIYSATKGNLDLMPVYDEGELGTSIKDIRYIVSHSPLEEDPKTKDFVTTVTVQRPENIPRIHGDVNLSIVFHTIGAGSIRVHIPLGNNDIETYRLIVPYDFNINLSGNAIGLTVLDGELNSRSRVDYIKNTEHPGN